MKKLLLIIGVLCATTAFAAQTHPSSGTANKAPSSMRNQTNPAMSAKTTTTQTNTVTNTKKKTTKKTNHNLSESVNI